MDFSGVILSWRRTGNLARIVRGLLPHVYDVMIWHNDGEDHPLSLADLGLIDGIGRVFIHNAPNVYTAGRFYAASMASCDNILTCDDDSLVKNWEAIKEAYSRDPSRIVAAMPDDHRQHHEHVQFGSAHEVLFGWGAAFDRRRTSKALTAYLKQFGRDDLFRRKADRLAALLMNCRHEMIPADFEELPGARDMGVALFLRPDHSHLTKQARQRAMLLLGNPA